MHKNAANLLSLARIPASFTLLLIYESDSRGRLIASLALALLIVASDILDGQLARRYKLVSKLGYVLDGLGDRAFLVAVYLIFVLNGALDTLLAWLLIFREVCQYAIRLVDIEWYEHKKSTDRIIAKLYSIAVYVLFIEIAVLSILHTSSMAPQQRLFVNSTLFILGTASYSRIVPRLWKVWRGATYG